MAWATSVIRWLAAPAIAAWYRSRCSSAMNTGSPPISITSASAAGLSTSGAVTPKQVPRSRSTSSPRPVNVITGCSASGSAPWRTAGSSTDTPYRPLAWASMRPCSGAPVAASPATRPGSASSGTVSMARSARRRTWLGSVITAPGKFACARRSEASDTADAATTWWPARARAAPSAVPALPAPMMPTASRAGRRAAGSALRSGPGCELLSGVISFQSSAGTGRRVVRDQDSHEKAAGR